MYQLALVVLLTDSYESEEKKVFSSLKKKIILFLLIVNSRKGNTKGIYFFLNAIFYCTDKYHNNSGLCN